MSEDRARWLIHCHDLLAILSLLLLMNPHVKVSPLTFSYGWVVSHHSFLGMWLPILAWIKVKPCYYKGTTVGLLPSRSSTWEQPGIQFKKQFIIPFSVLENFIVNLTRLLKFNPSPDHIFFGYTYQRYASVWSVLRVMFCRWLFVYLTGVHSN